MKSNKAARKILLVDDDEDDRKYFMDALKEIDETIECVTAKDGEQALNYLANADHSLPDYIFLDLRMPKVNGRRCLIEIKADERLQHIPVIIYTTSGDVAESEELQGKGAVRFITKPGDPGEIFYVLSLVLEEQWEKL